MKFFNFLQSSNKNYKSFRINTKIGDKFLNVNLTKTYESLDILSLKLFQKDLYRLFDADYGILVGRVQGNGGVGIPNCRVSVFTPLEASDEFNGIPTTLEDLKKIELLSIYPYKTVRDKDGDGKIYNLLPKYSKNRNFNGFPDNEFGIGATPKTPVGSFPEKEEILINETLAYVYDKYLKYTTITNESGDFILALPSNKSYDITMSCDITDIGRFSSSIPLLKLEGYPASFFNESGTLIKEDIDIEKLPNIEIQNSNIFIKPLWSQNDNSDVGINRLDFNLNKKITPHTVVFGNYFTQSHSSWWGDRILFRLFLGLRNLCFQLGINCPDNITSSSSSKLMFRIRFTLPLKIGRVTLIDIDCGDSSKDFIFCLRIIIKNIVPFLSLFLLKRKNCTLNGGKNGYSPFEIINLGKTSVCSRDAALSDISDGITDGLFLQSHERKGLDIKLFSIKNEISENDADILNNIPDNNDVFFNKFDYNKQIEKIDDANYIKFIDNGNFVMLIPSNREKCITDELGNLVKVSNDSQVGVFTSFRGYMYVQNTAPVDNPPIKDVVGKIRLKIPQFFDNENNDKRWIWKHFKFQAGDLYSVAQKTMIPSDTHAMPPADEASDDDSFGNFLLPVPDFTPKGWDEQTNIFFTGAFENDTNLGDYQISNFPQYISGNTEDKKYLNFFNHVTVLGTDIEGNLDTDSLSSENGLENSNILDGLKFNLFKDGAPADSDYSLTDPNANPSNRGYFTFDLTEPRNWKFNFRVLINDPALSRNYFYSLHNSDDLDTVYIPPTLCTGDTLTNDILLQHVEIDSTYLQAQVGSIGVGASPTYQLRLFHETAVDYYDITKSKIYLIGIRRLG